MKNFRDNVSRMTIHQISRSGIKLLKNLIHSSTVIGEFVAEESVWVEEQVGVSLSLSFEKSSHILEPILHYFFSGFGRTPSLVIT